MTKKTDEKVDELVNAKLSEVSEKVEELNENSNAELEAFKKKVEDDLTKKTDEKVDELVNAKLSEVSEKVEELNENSNAELEALRKKTEDDLTKKINILVNLNKLKTDELLVLINNRVSDLENMQRKEINSKFSELSDKIAALDNLEGMVDSKVIDNLNAMSLGLNTKLDNNVSELQTLKNSYKNQMEEITNKINNLQAYKDQKDKELTARVDLLKTEFKEYLDNKLERDTERKQKEVYEKVNLDKEYIEKKFLDFEVALVELSKSIDDKIENKLSLVKNEPAEIKSSYRKGGSSPSINKLNITKPLQDKEPSTREDKINRLINYIDTLISSGNYKTAKEYYIKLLSEYERYEEGNPHILVKIAQFHNKLKS